MFAVEIYAAVRRFVFVEGKSRREAARVFGLSRDTISKMCRYSAPPGYVRSKAPERPKLGPLIPVIDVILGRAAVGSSLDLLRRLIKFRVLCKSYGMEREKDLKDRLKDLSGALSPSLWALFDQCRRRALPWIGHLENKGFFSE